MFGRSGLTYDIDMCNGPLLKKMLLFAVPLMLSSMLQLLFNAVDVVVVSRFVGDDAMAAVGANGSLISLMVNLFIGLSMGANVLAARERGAGEREELHRTVHTAMALSVVGGVLLVVPGELCMKWILEWMQVPVNIRPMTELYLRIYFLGLPATVVYNFGAALLRSVGDTRRPMRYLTVAGVVNVGLNLLFVVGFSTGVAGVAIATVASQVISAGLVVRCLMRDTGDLRLEPKCLRIHGDKLGAILRVGLPAGVQGTITSFANVALQSAINSFGEVVIAGSAAAANIESFIYCGVSALNQATLSFTGQNLGAGKRERLSRVVVTGVFCVVMLCGAALLIYGLWGPQLLRIYSETDAVVQAGMERLDIVVTGYVFCGLLNIMVGAQRGLGHSLVPMIISVCSTCGLRLLVLATVFQIPQYHTIQTVYLVFPGVWAVTVTVQFISWSIIMRRLMRDLPAENINAPEMARKRGKQ